METKLRDLILTTLIGGANAALSIEAIIDLRPWAVAFGVAATSYCYYIGRKQYMDIMRNYVILLAFFKELGKK